MHDHPSRRLCGEQKHEGSAEKQGKKSLGPVTAIIGPYKTGIASKLLHVPLHLPHQLPFSTFGVVAVSFISLFTETK